MWLLLQYASVGLIILLASVFFVLIAKHVKEQKLIEYYRAQGVHAAAGYNKLIVGNLPTLRAVNDYCESLIGTQKPTPKFQILATLDYSTESKAEDSYDYTNNTVSLLNLGAPILFV